MPKDEVAQELAQQVQEAASGKTPADDEENKDRGDEAAAGEETEDTGAPVDGEKKEPETAKEEDKGGVYGIPKSRFDVINERRKEAEEKAASLETQLQQLQASQQAAAAQPAPDVQPDANEILLRQQLEAATRAQVEAVSNSDADAAVKAQMEMADVQAKLLVLKQPKVEKPVDLSAAVEEVKYNSALEEIKAKYPQLDESSKHYDETAVIEVNELFVGLVASGKSKTGAIARAAEYVFPGVKDRTPSRADTERNVENAQNAAPDIGGAGEAAAGDGLKGVNPLSLPDEDFAALPESKKKELRGDFL